MTTKELLIRIETKMDAIVSNSNRLMYAMLGIIAATVGSNFINSPVHVIISAYAATFSGIFVIASVVHNWKKLSIMKKALRLLFSFFLLLSIVCREWLISPPPEWYGIVINVFFIAISVLLVVSVWKDNSSM